MESLMKMVTPDQVQITKNWGKKEVRESIGKTTFKPTVQAAPRSPVKNIP